MGSMRIALYQDLAPEIRSLPAPRWEQDIAREPYVSPALMVKIITEGRGRCRVCGSLRTTVDLDPAEKRCVWCTARRINSSTEYAKSDYVYRAWIPNELQAIRDDIMAGYAHKIVIGSQWPEREHLFMTGLVRYLPVTA